MTKLERWAPVRPWGLVALLWGATLFRDMDRNVLATLREPILTDVPMTEAQFGLVASAFMWTYGVISPICGFLADRFGRRRIICAAVLTWSLVTCLTGQMHSFQGLFWARALMGVSEACYLPAALALITDFHLHTRSRAVAVHNSGIYVGAAVGGLGGYLAAATDWRLCFTLFGIAGVVYSLVLMSRLRDAARPVPAANAASPTSETNVFGALREVATRPAFWVLAGINGLLCIPSVAFGTWMPTFFRERFHLGIGLAGLSALSYIQVGYFVSGLVGATWSDFWTRKNLRARMLVPAIGFCLGIPGLLLVSVSPSLGVALVGVAFYAIARGFFDVSTMPILRELVASRYIATGYGFINLVGSLTGGVIVYLIGVMRDHHIGLHVAYQASAIALLLGAILLFNLKPRRAPTATPS